MRIFYIYNINDYFCSIYDKYPYRLYKMIEDAYLTKKYDIRESANLFDQIIINYNKLFMNNYIAANNKLDLYYYHRDSKHLISNREEYSKLLVTSYCLKLKSNINYPKFFDDIDSYSDSIFVCDFDNSDYFWLNKVKKRHDKLIKQ